AQQRSNAYNLVSGSWFRGRACIHSSILSCLCLSNTMVVNTCLAAHSTQQAQQQQYTHTRIAVTCMYPKALMYRRWRAKIAVDTINTTVLKRRTTAYISPLPNHESYT
ncbi:unnamed protein product, partial [Ectocarpus sp. 12 AP-2014]